MYMSADPHESEVWRDVSGYEGIYQVSNLGQVYSVPRRGSRGGLMKTPPNRHGYPEVNLTRRGAQRVHMVHVLVAAAFIGPRPSELIIRHLNGNPANNNVANLAYGSMTENQIDSVEHGTQWQSRKTHCPQGHPYDALNTYVLPSRPRARYCKACGHARSRCESPEQRSRRAARQRKRRAQQKEQS